MTEPYELSPRLIAVASMVARGYSDKRIAGVVAVSERQVRTYISQIEDLCDLDRSLNTRVQIANWWRSHIRITLSEDTAA